MTTARLLILGFLLALSGPSFAGELTAAKRADIEKLLEMTGAAAVGKQIGVAALGHMAQVIRKMRPDIPQHVIDTGRKR